MNTNPQRQMKRSLHEAFGYRGCPICHVVDEDESHFMATLQYETFKEEKVRQDVVSSNGYCNFHFYQMSRLSSPIVNALLTRDLIEGEIKEIEGGSFGSNLETSCPVCQYSVEREDLPE